MSSSKEGPDQGGSIGSAAPCICPGHHLGGSAHHGVPAAVAEAGVTACSRRDGHFVGRLLNGRNTIAAGSSTVSACEPVSDPPVSWVTSTFVTVAVIVEFRPVLRNFVRGVQEKKRKKKSFSGVAAAFIHGAAVSSRATKNYNARRLVQPGKSSCPCRL